MKLKITPTSTTNSIADAFRAAYPFLDMKFYKKEHDSHEGSPASEEVADETLLSDLADASAVDQVELHGTTKVEEVEAYFEEHFGLHVQVFRKSGEQWLQTSATDHWTLEKQNRIAEESEAVS